MSFDLDKIVAEQHLEPFVFSFAGREWTLPHYRNIDWRAIVMAETSSEAAYAAFQSGLGDDYEEFLTHPLPIGGLNSLFEAWRAHAGVSPGE